MIIRHVGSYIQIDGHGCTELKLLFTHVVVLFVTTCDADHIRVRSLWRHISLLLCVYVGVNTTN